MPLDDIDARAGFDVEWPSGPAIGPPDAAYIDETLGGQVTLVWRSRDGLPDTLAPGGRGVGVRGMVPPKVRRGLRKMAGRERP